MFWIKATTRFISAWRRPDEMVREVETELRIHIEKRTRANIEQGMRPDDARRCKASVTSSGSEITVVKSDGAFLSIPRL